MEKDKEEKSISQRLLEVLGHAEHELKEISQDAQEADEWKAASAAAHREVAHAHAEAKIAVHILS